jgi:hypothetical protein
LDLETDKLATPDTFAQSSDDPNYQPYQCAQCGQTGNQPMTTLAQAEWLKRLASHTREPATAHPHLMERDITQLFYGAARLTTTAPAGMLAGTSRMLHYALAEAIVGEPVNNAKRVLDRATNGRWRIWQTTSWGVSESRNTGESVILAHVCLPLSSGSREFTLAAQTSHADVSNTSTHHAGIKMQRLLTQSLTELIRPQD